MRIGIAGATFSRLVTCTQGEDQILLSRCGGLVAVFFGFSLRKSRYLAEILTIFINLWPVFLSEDFSIKYLLKVSNSKNSITIIAKWCQRIIIAVLWIIFYFHAHNLLWKKKGVTAVTFSTSILNLYCHNYFINEKKLAVIIRTWNLHRHVNQWIYSFYIFWGFATLRIKNDNINLQNIKPRYYIPHF